MLHFDLSRSELVLLNHFNPFLRFINHFYFNDLISLQMTSEKSTKLLIVGLLGDCKGVNQLWEWHLKIRPQIFTNYKNEMSH